MTQKDKRIEWKALYNWAKYSEMVLESRNQGSPNVLRGRSKVRAKLGHSNHTSKK